MEASRVFEDGALEGRVAIVTGGGTNLGKAAAVRHSSAGYLRSDSVSKRPSATPTTAMPWAP